MKKYIPFFLCIAMAGCEQPTKPSDVKATPTNTTIKTEKISLNEFSADMYYDEYTQNNWPKLYDLIGAAGVERLKNLDRQAVEFAYADSACHKIETNGVSMERTTKEEIVVFIDCANPNDELKSYRVYVSESDIQAFKSTNSN